MKSAQFTTNELVYKSGIDKHPVFLETKQLAREINLLIEGKQLGADHIHSLFTGIEQQMTAGNQNKTLLGKGADAVGAVGAKIAGLVGSLKDTTVVQGVDDAWADLKNTAAAKLEKSPGGSTVLRNIDRYRQLAKKYPQTSKFFWNAAAVVGGLMSGGLAVPAILGAMKGIDALVQGKEFSSAVGQGLGQFGKTSAVMGLKNLAVSAANATDIPNAPVRPDYHDPVYDPPTDPNVTPPGPVNPPPVTPDLPTSVVAAKGDTLSQIAQANQTSVKALMQANPHITNPNALLPGTQISLPPVNSTTYMGGVGTASDTAAGVASGKFTDIPTALANQRAAMMRENILAAIGFTATRLPMNEMVDKYTTVRTWALNESLGRKSNRSLQLTEDGVNVVLYNIEKIHEHVLKEAVYDRPANGNDAAAQAKAGNPGNTSTNAGPAGKLPGGNVGGLATGTAPAGNTMPYLAADPEGKFDTKHKGGVGGKFMDKVEGGLKRAGNWLSGKWKSATTKFEANRAKRRLQDAEIGNDSDAIAQWLISDQKVPQDVVTALYQELGFPAPAGMQAAGGAEAGAEAGTDAAAPAATNAGAASGTDALGAGAWDRVNDIPNKSDDELMATWKEWEKIPAAKTSGGPAYLATQFELQKRGLIGGDATSGTGGTATQTGTRQTSRSGGAPTLGTGEIPGRDVSRSDYKAQQQAERLARRNAQGGGPTPRQEKAAVKDFQSDADSLIRDLLNMSNVTQPAYVKYIRDRLSQHFPDAAAAPVAAPAVANAADAAAQLGPKGVASSPPEEKVAAESRRRFGGKYVRESAVDKMHKDFEHFVNSIG
jgi:LysM repeat protein